MVKIKWMGSEDDQTAHVGEYLLRVEQLNDQDWWYACYLKVQSLTSLRESLIDISDYWDRSKRCKSRRSAKFNCINAMKRDQETPKEINYVIRGNVKAQGQ